MEGQRGAFAGSGLISESFLDKLKSVGAVPVINRAPRLNVRFWIAHWTKTRTRLRKVTKYIRWMKTQTSQAMKPERWAPKTFATAAARPITAREPLSK